MFLQCIILPNIIFPVQQKKEIHRFGTNQTRFRLIFFGGEDPFNYFLKQNTQIFCDTCVIWDDRPCVLCFCVVRPWPKLLVHP